MSPQELPPQLGRPALPRPEAEGIVLGDLELQVHADVDDHSRCTKRLRVEHPELLAGILEVAEVVHQALGVECPALAVPGDPAHQPLPPVEQIGTHDRLSDLKVMPWDTLVVDRRHVSPGGEVLDPLWDSPPDPPGPAEILTRRGVVDAAV